MNTLHQNELNIASIRQILLGMARTLTKSYLLQNLHFPTRAIRNLYYARAIDLTILYTFLVIASEQVNPTERTMRCVHQLLDYMHINPNVVIRFYTSGMIRQVHSAASYMPAGRVQPCRRILSLVACLVMAHQPNATVILRLHVKF